MTPIYLILATLLVLLPTQVSADTIHGCVKQKSGKLRIVGDPGQCTDKEAAISWNNEGSQGPEGPQGPQGEAGPAPPRFELVGFTSATFVGDEGVLGFTLACQAQFAGSRMCSSAEVMNTVDVPAGLSSLAWVRPSFVSISGTQALDASGIYDSGDDLTCRGWRFADSGHSGLLRMP